jgi:23S rRNA (cytidine1920-2'-O)/16S rRNA (cytidine1409-2'-O)-methyltransferase
LDLLLVERGLVPSREAARGLILSGVVFVEGKKVDKAGAPIHRDAQIVLASDPCPYVGRGGVKLAGAMLDFGISVADKVAIDVGASTGGFTDYLLQHGAKRVYAVDVGYGQLAYSIRCDPRVVVMERQNIRFLPEGSIPETADLVTIDVSFVSLEKIIPGLIPLLADSGEIVALVKPQFEVGKGEVGAGGIVRRAEQHQAVLERIRQKVALWGEGAPGLTMIGSVPSSLKGKKGNQEFFIYLKKGLKR